MLNVVNFGGGSYVLYAEVRDDGTIEVDPEPYSDNFARPARLLPVEAKALVAAIDLIGEHLPEGSLTSAREKIVAALGADPIEEGLQVADAGGDDSDDRARRLAAIAGRRLLGSSTTRPTRTSSPSAIVEPYALINGREGWYVGDVRPRARTTCATSAWTASSTPRSSASTSSRGPRSTRPPTSTAGRAPARCRRRAPRACGSRPSAPAGRARSGTVAQELADGAVIVELSFAGIDWLVREVLKEAGDAAVLEPADAREAVLAAARRLRKLARA